MRIGNDMVRLMDPPGRNKEFIAWDGEGIAQEELPVMHARGYYRWEDSRKFFFNYEHIPQPYVLLANSKGDRITDENGLSTTSCLDLILDTKVRYPNSIFVGFGFNYDVNQILKDVPESQLRRLYEEGRARFSGYGIKWYSRKSFLVSNFRKHRSAVIYDVFSHFQSSFIKACEKYLGEDDPELEIIRKGKEKRDVFSWDELDDFIIPYNNTELSMLVRMMDILRADYEAVDLVPSEWYGPGAIVKKAFFKHNVRINRDIPKEVLDASQSAYAGGRFEQFKMGRHEGTVYQYDLHSAYPAAAVRLPDISVGYWEHVSTFEPGTFGVWHISYKQSNENGRLYTNGPQPLFCRSQLGLISYPSEVRGWYWTPEAELVSDNISEGYVFRSVSDNRPFAFIEAMYDERRLLKSQGSSSERALKLCMNSAYGKLCQTIASDNGPPRWHQLEYAGYITSYVRAQLYRALQLNPDAAIAVETDAIISTLPLALPLSDRLGDWEEKTYDEITYLQSGFYYTLKDGTLDVRYRGMDKGKDGQPAGLPYDFVLDYLRNNTGVTFGHLASLPCYTSRFVGLGLSLCTSSVWRSWEKKPKKIILDEPRSGPRKGMSKRAHMRESCAWCEDGISMYDAMHDLFISGANGLSYARDLPWREVDDQVDPPLDWGEWYGIWEDSMYPHGG